MENDHMFVLADELKRLRELKAELEEHLSDVNGRIEATDYRLSELMAETETQNFTRAGTMFFLKTTTRASAIAGGKEKLFEALKANGYGSLVTETVNANSLSSFVKEQIGENDETLPGWLSGLVNVFDKTTVGVRKATK